MNEMPDQIMKLPAPIFVGFFPKVTQQVTQLNPEWLTSVSVKEICSVSRCISKGPDNWIEHWKHNSQGFYDSEQTAVSFFADDPNRYDVYAYELFPFCVLDRTLEEVEVDLQIGKVPSDYEFLGYDIVTRSMGAYFECSPLSCNYAAKDFATNAHCLFDDETQAYRALFDMSVAGSAVEPGPYYLFKVYRKNRA